MTWGVFRCVAGVALVALGVPLAVLLFAVVCTPTNAGRDGVPWFRAFVFLMLALPVAMVWGGIWMYRAGRAGYAEAQAEGRYQRHKERAKAAAKAKVRRPKKHWQDDEDDDDPPRPRDRADDHWSPRNRPRDD